MKIRHNGIELMKLKELRSFKQTETTSASTQGHIPEHLNPQTHRSKGDKSRIKKSNHDHNKISPLLKQ